MSSALAISSGVRLLSATSQFRITLVRTKIRNGAESGVVGSDPSPTTILISLPGSLETGRNRQCHEGTVGVGLGMHRRLSATVGLNQALHEANLRHLAGQSFPGGDPARLCTFDGSFDIKVLAAQRVLAWLSLAQNHNFR